MEAGEAIKKLLKAGFTELSQTGSHKKFGREKERITIVFHKSPKERLHIKTAKQVHKLLDK